MQPDEKKRILIYLQDALDTAIELLANLSGTGAKDYEYSKVKWIAERGIEIIREALKRASFLENSLPISDMNKIFATRNKIAHEYDIVDSYLCSTPLFKNISRY